MNKKASRGRMEYFEELIVQKPTQVLDQFLSFIEDKNKFSRKELLEIYHNQLESYVPASIFTNKFTTLEALIIFLRDHRGYSVNKISQLIGRSPACVSNTYYRSKKKKLLVNPKDFDMKIPIEIFRSDRFSAQEALIKCLLDKGLPLRIISRKLDLDPRVTWTIRQRIRNKSKVS